MKKNPFKMLGSYIGALISGGYFLFMQDSNFIQSAIRIFDFSPDTLNDTLPFLDPLILALTSFIIIGFLVGWGVEILIKKKGGKK